MTHNLKAIAISVILAVAMLALLLGSLVPDVLSPAWKGAPGSSQTGQAQPDLSRFTARECQTIASFSTVSSLILYDDYADPARILRFDDTWAEITRLLTAIDQAVSVSIPTSDIARFNALAYGESLPVSGHTAAIFKVARAAYDSTGGMYDPTVYPLVDLWGFTPRFNASDYTPTEPYDRVRKDAAFGLPDQKYVAAFLQLVDLGKVILAGDDQAGYTLIKRIPPVKVDGVAYQARLDFGGIAKGYAVDCVARLLAARGYAYGSFSCGGSSIVLLKNASPRSRENGTYRFALGLSKPRKGLSDEGIYLSVATRDVRLSSSGDYDHCYRIDGVIYSHIISPKTGWPMNTPAAAAGQKGIAVLTALGGSAASDDAMTTALCAMGFEKALAYFNAHLKDWQMAMVLFDSGQDFHEVLTNIPAAEYAISDPAYRLASHLDADGSILYDGVLLRQD